MGEKRIELDELIDELFKRAYGSPKTVIDNLNYFHFYIGCITMTRFWFLHEENRHLKDIANIKKDREKLGEEPNKDLVDLYVEIT